MGAVPGFSVKGSSGFDRGYVGIMEKKMETTRFYEDYIGDALGLYRNNGTENGNYNLGLSGLSPLY